MLYYIHQTHLSSLEMGLGLRVAQVLNSYKEEGSYKSPKQQPLKKKVCCVSLCAFKLWSQCIWKATKHGCPLQRQYSTSIVTVRQSSAAVHRLSIFESPHLIKWITAHIVNKTHCQERKLYVLSFCSKSQNALPKSTIAIRQTLVNIVLSVSWQMVWTCNICNTAV